MKKIYKILAAIMFLVPALAFAFNGFSYDQPTGMYMVGDDMNSYISLTPGTGTDLFKAATAFNFLDGNSHSIANFLPNGGNAHIQLGAFDAGSGTSLDISDSTQTFTLYAGNELSVQDPATGTKWLDITPATQQVALNGALALKDQYETPTSASTVTVAPSTTILTMHPAGPIGTLTIVFPNSPIDGQELKINTTQVITGITMSAGTTVYGAVPALNVAGHVAYEFSTGDNAWHAE